MRAGSIQQGRTIRLVLRRPTSVRSNSSIRWLIVEGLEDAGKRFAASIPFLDPRADNGLLMTPRLTPCLINHTTHGAVTAVLVFHRQPASLPKCVGQDKHGTNGNWPRGVWLGLLASTSKKLPSPSIITLELYQRLGALTATGKNHAQTTASEESHIAIGDGDALSDALPNTLCSL